MIPDNDNDDNFSCRAKRSASLCTDNDLKNSGICISPTAAIHTECRKHAFPNFAFSLLTFQGVNLNLFCAAKWK